MAVSFVANAATIPSVLTASAVTMPTWVAGDKLFLFVGGKASSNATVITAPTVTGYSLISSQGPVGTGTSGNDSGTTHLFIYERTMVSGDAAPTVTPTGTGAFSSWWFMAESWRPTSGSSWTFTDGNSPTATGADAVTTTPMTATLTSFSSAPTTGDAITVVGSIPTDSATAVGTTTITATGLSGGTITGTRVVAQPQGSDTGAVAVRWESFTGTASTAITPSITITGASNHSGGLGAVLIRETAPVAAAELPEFVTAFR